MDSIIIETRSDYSTIDYPKRRDEYDLIIKVRITENVFVSGKFIFFSNAFLRYKKLLKPIRHYYSFICDDDFY